MSNGKLVLTRKPGESIKIGESLLLTVREVHPKKLYIQWDKSAAAWYALNQRIEIPTEFGLMTVTICSITKGIVKFLFEADKRIRIVRTEIAA